MSVLQQQQSWSSELECQYKVSSEMSDRRIQKQVREMSRREVASSVSWYRLVLENEETVLLLGRLGLWEVSWRPRTFTSSRKRELEGFGAVVDPKWSVRARSLVDHRTCHLAWSLRGLWSLFVSSGHVLCGRQLHEMC